MLWSACRAGLALAIVLLANAGAAEPPWRHAYGGGDATGKDVIALWQFDGGSLADASGNGHDLKLQGQSRLVAEGRFGGCLESFPADKENDKPQGAVTPNHPDLTPAGSFRIEAWLKLKPEATKYPSVYIVDKKVYYYDSELPKANKDYCFYLNRAGKQWTMRAVLGFGTESETYTSRPLGFPASEWHHVALTYDGAGTVRFFLDGRSMGGGTREGRGAVAHGQFALFVGDRAGSIHKGCAGFLDQVRICRGDTPFFTGILTVGATGGRTAFARMERDAVVPLTVSNDTGKALPAGRLVVELAGQSRTVPLPPLAPAQEQRVTVPVDTALRPGEYALRAKAEIGGDTVAARVPVLIRPRPLPHTMPVVMWGTGDLAEVRRIGFTHQLRWMGYFDAKAIETKQPIPPESLSADLQAGVVASLDEYFRQGVGAILNFQPARTMTRNAKTMETYGRVGRDGKPLEHANVCGNVPGVEEIGHAVSASAMQAFGDFPAVEACMIQSEVRDGCAPCFHSWDKQAFEAYAGYPIPAEIQSKNGVRWQQLPDFPADRIIPDDHPILTYYRWFWKDGDGWNRFHSAIHRGAKSTGRTDVWTYHDPAVRVPSIWGSGGEVDVISQWTYSYPDPIKIGQATDELFAMAEGHPGQKVMKMTQMIWKRFQTTNPKAPADKLATWEKELPKAIYYTIAPDHLREAFWSKISRPVQGIMYHGWGSLVKLGDNSGSYTFTNPGTEPALVQLLHEVVEPLGPTLIQVPDAPADVALLESFTSQMFAGRGPYGWGTGWTADAHLVLQWARYQPRVVYEETILRDGLAGVKVLVMPDCDVLTKSVEKRIRAFQDAGGIVVADEHVAPAILPDIVLPSYARTGQADADKQALQALAEGLREELDQVYVRPFDSSEADLVVRCRRAGTADYVFVVNDRRAFGDYVGQHGKVMERGLPLAGEVILPAAKPFVYDLVAHAPVAVNQQGDRLHLPCELDPGGGGLYLLLPQPLGRASIDVPVAARRGETAPITVQVLDARGMGVRAVLPLRIDILDPAGRPAEYSGYYGAANGQVEIDLLLAANDEPGSWRVRVRNLASGNVEETTFEVGK